MFRLSSALIVKKDGCLGIDLRFIEDLADGDAAILRSDLSLKSIEASRID